MYIKLTKAFLQFSCRSIVLFASLRLCSAAYDYSSSDYIKGIQEGAQRFNGTFQLHDSFKRVLIDAQKTGVPLEDFNLLLLEKNETDFVINGFFITIFKQNRSPCTILCALMNKNNTKTLLFIIENGSIAQKIDTLEEYVRKVISPKINAPKSSVESMFKNTTITSKNNLVIKNFFCYCFNLLAPSVKNKFCLKYLNKAQKFCCTDIKFKHTYNQEKTSYFNRYDQGNCYGNILYEKAFDMMSCSEIKFVALLDKKNAQSFTIVRCVKTFCKETNLSLKSEKMRFHNNISHETTENSKIKQSLIDTLKTSLQKKCSMRFLSASDQFFTIYEY